MSETVQFRVSSQNMYECHSQNESRLSPTCNPENELSPLTHVDQCPCKSCRIPDESNSHFWSVQKKSTRFVVTQSSLYSAVSHELVPCCCMFSVSCHFLSVVLPSLELPGQPPVPSILPWHQSSTIPVFYDTSLPRRQSSMIPVFHDTSKVFLTGHHFGLASTSFLTDCRLTRARPTISLPLPQIWTELAT